MREWEMGPLYRIGTIAVLATHSIRYSFNSLAIVLNIPYSSFHSHLESLSESPHSHIKCHPRPSFQLQSTIKKDSKHPHNSGIHSVFPPKREQRPSEFEYPRGFQPTLSFQNREYGCFMSTSRRVSTSLSWHRSHFEDLRL